MKTLCAAGVRTGVVGWSRMRSAASDFLEARVDGHLKKIGALNRPSIETGRITAERFILYYEPVPTLGNFDPESWLKKQFLVFTHHVERDGGSSSTSWCCRFVSCRQFARIKDDMIAMTDVVFETGKVRE